MNRREVLKRTAFLTGAALSAPLISSILSGCTPETKQTGQLQVPFFDPDQFQLVTELADVILPATDSPSASAVGVPQTIEEMVRLVYPPEDRKAYQKGFTILREFLNSESDLRAGVQKLESQNAPEEVRQAYLHFKQQTIAYYLTTEAVAKNHLNYLPVPGAYEACIQLSDVDGKAWAL